MSVIAPKFRLAYFLKAIIDNVAFAINQEYCTDENHLINNLDEVALIPPVSGG